MATVLLSVSTNAFRGLSLATEFDGLAGRLVHPTAPVLLTKSGPLSALHSTRPAQRQRVGPLTN